MGLGFPEANASCEMPKRHTVEEFYQERGKLSPEQFSSLIISYYYCNRNYFPITVFSYYFLFSYKFFPITIATNCHKLNSFKQDKLILLQFWKSKVQNQPHWTEGRLKAGLVPSRDSRGKSVSLPFPSSKGQLHSLAGGPSSIIKSSAQCLASVIAVSSSPVIKSPSCSLLYRTL